MRQSERFSISPSLALQYEFEDALRRTYRRQIFCAIRHEYVSGPSTVRYDYITEKDLVNKDFYVDFWDYKVGVCFVGKQCDPDMKKGFFTRALESYSGVL